MITVNDLCVSYDGVEILHGVDAAFPEGKVSVVLGPNGCGKSTLLKSIIRLNTEVSGAVTVGGENVDGLSQKELSRRVAYLPQSHNIPDITVERLVMHGRFPYLGYPRHYGRTDREKVRDALKWMGLTDYAGRKMEQLSGGQRQKVYLAMALAQDTDVILMDEPTTFLDIRNQLEMLELICRLSAEGKTVVMILHDFDLTLRCADHCLLLGDGNVLRAGAAREVLASPELARVFGVTPRFYETEDGTHCYVSAATAAED